MAKPARPTTTKVDETKPKLDERKSQAVAPNQLTNLNVPEFYGHSVQLFMSSTDFTLVFARQVPVVVGSAAGAAVLPSVAIHLSPGTAKDLQTLLTRNLADFEADWGKIETSYTRRAAAEKTKKQ